MQNYEYEIVTVKPELLSSMVNPVLNETSETSHTGNNVNYFISIQ
jgi:hypothetical protein